MQIKLATLVQNFEKSYNMDFFHISYFSGKILFIKGWQYPKEK